MPVSRSKFISMIPMVYDRNRLHAIVSSGGIYIISSISDWHSSESQRDSHNSKSQRVKDSSTAHTRAYSFGLRIRALPRARLICYWFAIDPQKKLKEPWRFDVVKKYR
jgi:hypothetical protein